MVEQKQLNLNLLVNDGDSFYAHEVAINFNPLQFIFDFKSITPRVDQRSTDGQVFAVVKHNVVMLDPFHAKQIAIALTGAIDNFEKQFGSIEKSKHIEVFEKKLAKQAKTSGAQAPTYFG